MKEGAEGFRWHYLVYRITNLDDGRYYIGQHRTTNPDDSYMGSGAALNREYDRYAAMGLAVEEHFRKEILFDFRTFDEMNQKEKELVNEQTVSDPMSYNKARGGSHQAQYPEGCIIIEHAGRRGSIREWSEWIGMSPDIIRQRYRKGMQMAEIIAVPPCERDKVWFASTGEGHTVYEWCDKYGLEYNLVSARLRAGWSVDQAVVEPAWNGKTYLYRGRPYKLNQLAEMSGISKVNLLARIINYKWTVERAVETPLIYNPVSIWEQRFEWNGGSYTIEQLAEMSEGRLFKWTIHDMLKDGKQVGEIMKSVSPAVDRSWSKKLYDYHGRKITMKEGARIAELTVDGLYGRIFNEGIEFERAVDMPRRNKRGKLFYVDGIGKTIHNWAESSGLSQNLLYQRIYCQGMTMEEALAKGKPVHKPYKKRVNKINDLKKEDNS